MKRSWKRSWKSSWKFRWNQIWNLIWIVGILSMLISLPVLAADSATASLFRVEKASGTVKVSRAGNAAAATDGMQLYNDDVISTAEKSYAHISLDSSKVIKLDAKSTATMHKAGKKLAIRLDQGSLLFEVKEKLADDESMIVGSATMSMSIRGTAGMISTQPISGGTRTIIELYEGKVLVSCPGHPDRYMWSGEKLIYDSTTNVITRELINTKKIPGFAAVEIVTNQHMAQAAITHAGVDYPWLASHANEKLLTDENPEGKNNGTGTNPGGGSGGSGGSSGGSGGGHSGGGGGKPGGGDKPGGGGGSDPSHTHDYKPSVIEKATCTTDGKTLYTCSCGESYTDNVPEATGHTPGEWIIEKEATYEEEGERARYCKICENLVEREPIDKLTETYKVSFVNFEGEEISKQDVESGKDATPPEYSGDSAYKFLCWEKSYRKITEDTKIRPIVIAKSELDKYSEFVNESTTYYIRYVDAGGDTISLKKITLSTASYLVPPELEDGETWDKADTNSGTGWEFYSEDNVFVARWYVV